METSEARAIAEVDRVPALTRSGMRHGEEGGTGVDADVGPLSGEWSVVGLPVRLRTVSHVGPGLDSDASSLIRAAAAVCATELGAKEAVRINSRPAMLWAWLPAAFTIGFLGWRVVRRHASNRMPSNRVLLALSGVAAGVAAVDSALHLGIPLLPATERNVALANRIVVPPALRKSFQWLASQQRVLKPVESGRPRIRSLLEHVELATLQRDITDWGVSDDLWQKWVLSPQIEGVAGENAWRRALWEYFHPRVRKETSAEAAAALVARHLALRVRVVGDSDIGRHVSHMWARGEADPVGVHRLYIAALRSVGLPSRFDSVEGVLFHDGKAWQPAPEVSVSLGTDGGSDQSECLGERPRVPPGVEAE